jgi:katanin p80 WD40 repeat-containing subunit B1
MSSSQQAPDIGASASAASASASATPAARTFQLEEFVAHSGSKVNSVCLGKQSCRVLASGGDDCLVHVWRLGKRQPLLSLSGHSTPVDFVVFDPLEEVLAGGSRGGSVKLWNLAKDKSCRTVPCHRSSVTCVDFHPYGEFFATSSLDTNVKIWDMRKKGCMQTIRTHTAPVRAVRHSPDGRWIVSSDDDGVVKIWDLTAGKHVKDLPGLKGPVSCIDFHPNEFIMACNSGARNSVCWDMDSFGMIAASSSETSAVHKVMFSPGGEVLCSASSDYMKVWNFETMECHDAVSIPWGNVHDIAMSDSSMFGVSLTDNTVAVHVIELALVAPFGQSAEVGVTAGAAVSAAAAGTSTASYDDVKRADRVNNAAAAVAAAAASAAERASLSDSKGPNYSSDPFIEVYASPKPAPSPESHTDAVSTQSQSQSQPHPQAPAQTQPSPQQYTPSTPAQSQVQAQVHTPASISPNMFARVSPLQDSVVSNVNQTSSPAAATATATAAAAAAPSPVPVTVTATPTSTQATPQPSVPHDEAVRGQLLKDHKMICGILAQRLNNMRLLTSLWKTGNVNGCIQALAKMDDPSCAVDFLGASQQSFQSKILDLDTCVMLLPILKNLLMSQFEHHVTIALQYMKMLLRNFSELIVNTRSAASAPIGGANPALEERLIRCNACYEQFKAVCPRVEPIAQKTNAIGLEAQTVMMMMNKLLD